MTTAELKHKLQALLKSAAETRYRGALNVQFAQSRGYADGYMRALMDAGLMDRNEVLELVHTVHAKVH